LATSRVTLPALAVAFIAGLVALHDTQNLLACLSGLTLLLMLFAYDQRGARSGWQSLAFAFVCGLALLLTILYPLVLLLSGFALTNQFPALVWFVGTAAFWFIDRARIDSRQAATFPGYAQAPVPQAVSTTYPVSPYSVAPTPAPAERTFSPVPAPPPHSVAQPAPAPSFDPVISPTVTEPPPVAPPTPPSGPPAVITGQGKEVGIYVNMLGEGMNMLRAVRAEHLGRDFYIIVEPMPPDETWQFVTGQVVRCQKKNLSSGKGLVAYEEAPRA
jgi:hypothetical protein